MSVDFGQERLVQERVASLKVGVVSGLTTGLTTGLITGLLWIGSLFFPFPDWSGTSEFLSAHNLFNALFSAAIAGFSGFLFGITYRHIIRQEQDNHLQAGAVGAFGLVRGLAQIDPNQFSHPNEFSLSECLMAGITLGESLLLFGLARIVLDICFDRGWIQRFPIKY